MFVAANVSIALFPLDLLPGVFRYGYAFPFYNISSAVRTILFNTKNDGKCTLLFLPLCILMDLILVGMNFGILFAWIALSCTTLPLFQWIVRRRDVNEWRREQAPHGKEQI